MMVTFIVAGTMAAPTQPRVSRVVDQIFEASKSLPINYNDGIGWGVDAYKMYRGDGSTAAGWPSLSEWVSYQQMCVSCGYGAG